MKKIIGIILLFIGVLLVGFVLFKTFNKPANDKTKYTDRETIDEELSNFQDVTNELEKIQYYNESFEVKIETDEEDTSINHLYINDEKVFTTDPAKSYIDKILLYGNYVLLITNGVDTNLAKIYIYDVKGKLIKEIRDLLIDNMKINKYEVFQDYIDMNGLRVTTDNMFVVKGEFLNICDDKVLEANDIKEDTIVKADYRLEYDVDNGFVINEKPESKVTLQEYKEFNCFIKGDASE